LCLNLFTAGRFNFYLDTNDNGTIAFYANSEANLLSNNDNANIALVSGGIYFVE
jgi:hypothetical protein